MPFPEVEEDEDMEDTRTGKDEAQEEPDDNMYSPDRTPEAGANDDEGMMMGEEDTPVERLLRMSLEESQNALIARRRGSQHRGKLRRLYGMCRVRRSFANYPENSYVNWKRK